MKYVKMLGLLAVAAAALIAFAGVASATTVTSNGAAYTSTLKASVGSEGMTMHGVGDISCTTSNIEGKIEKHGVGVTATGPVSMLTFENCNQHVKVLKKGTLEAHTVGTGPNGTLIWSGAEITIYFTLGIFGNHHCVFGTNKTHLGTITGNKTGHANLDMSSATIPVVSGSGLCGESAEWTGNYTFTVPSNLALD